MTATQEITSHQKWSCVRDTFQLTSKRFWESISVNICSVYRTHRFSNKLADQLVCVSLLLTVIYLAYTGYILPVPCIYLFLQVLHCTHLYKTFIPGSELQLGGSRTRRAEALNGEKKTKIRKTWGRQVLSSDHPAVVQRPTSKKRRQAHVSGEVLRGNSYAKH